jgi:uncharacterized small protein (DUF1192 family)
VSAVGQTGKGARMDIDDLEPRKQPSKPKDLAVYSVADLRAYIELLKAEILRAEGVIKKKDAHKDAASAFFKK